MERKLKALILELILCVLAGTAVFLLKPVKTLHALLVWAVFPVFAIFISFKTVKKGVNPYLAWLPPPIGLTLGALAGTLCYLPNGGSMLLCAFASLFGAAAGDVYLNRGKKR